EEAFEVGALVTLHGIEPDDVVTVEGQLGRCGRGRLLGLRRRLRRLGRLCGRRVLGERVESGAAGQQGSSSERGSNTRAAHTWRPQLQMHSTSSVRKHVFQPDTVTYPRPHTNTCMTSLASSMPRRVNLIVSPSTTMRPASVAGARASP